ncbi:DUF1214 domain-containing protein [Monashia sp. NPDC004114]
MTRRTSALLATVVGAVCVYAIVRIVLASERLVRNDIMQGALVGIGLAVVTLEVLSRIKATKVNGWTTILGCGVPGNGPLMRATCTWLFPGPVNVPEEATYWITQIDGAGRSLSGQHSYVMRFPAGGLPPNDAFWSLTMGDTRNRFVPNPIGRYSVSDRSGLAPNADGSVDIYIQNSAPPGRETNWLPAPEGKFTLWLRVYLPGQVILDGAYAVPPVARAA